MSIPGAERSGTGPALALLLLEHIRDYAVFALDVQGRVLSWSAPAQRLLGYGAQEAVGQPAERFYTAEDIAEGVPARELQQALMAGRVEEDRWLVRKDGSRFWSGGVTTTLHGADGGLRGFAKVVRDRTAERQAEQARDEALAYARSIVETVREPLVVLDGKLRVLSANRAFYAAFRVAPTDTEGRLLYDLGNGQWNIPRLRSLLEDILPQRSAFEAFEVEHDFPGVGHKAMLLNARRLRQANAECILLACEDVTERRRAEAERQALETRFTSLVRNVKDHAIFTLDAEGRITSWNVAAEQILGYPEDEVIGLHFGLIFTPEDGRRGLPEAELHQAREHGRAEDERWHLRKGGQRFWALGIVSALHDADGRLIGFSKILRDMTAWKQAQQALVLSEARYLALVQASSDAVYRMNADWTELRELVGRDFIADTGAPGRTWLEQYAEPSDRPRVLAAIDKAIRNKAPFELEHRLRRADGSPGWSFSRAVPMLDEAGGIVEWVGMASDITERKRAGEAMYRSLFESIDEGFCIVQMMFDAHGRAVDYRHLEVNPAFERQSGLKHAAGRTALELVPGLDAYWIETFARVAATGEATRYRHLVSPLQRWYEGRAWRHGRAEQQQVAILFNDVTASVQAEAALHELNESLERRVRERTRQVRELARRLTLSELEERHRISQILHDDLQQLLYGIEMKLRQVDADLPPAQAAPLGADLRDALAWVTQAITTTRRLTVDLSPPILQKEGLADALEWLQRQMGELHGLEVTLEAAHSFYMPDQDLRVLLFQVVRELLFNVAKHSGTKRATVRLEEVAGQLVIQVIDEGAGFDAGQAAGREGDGFGLFSVRERLGLVGGSLTVRTRPGQGTRIEIHVPPAGNGRPVTEGAST